MVRRAARHSRTSSGCSEAAQQLEQQLLDVFEAGSITPAAAAGGTAVGSSQLTVLALTAAAAAAGRSPRNGLLFGTGSSAGAAAAAAAFGTARIGNAATAAAAASSQSYAPSQSEGRESEAAVVQHGSDEGVNQQQQQQQQQHLPAECDSWLDNQSHATTAADSADPAAAGTSTSMQESSCTTLGGRSTPRAAAAAAVAAAAEGSSDHRSSSSSSSSSTAGDILFDFTFSLQALQPLDPADLQPPSGGLNPTDPSLKPNRLVLQLGDSLYTLPPPAPKPQTGSEFESSAVGGDGEYEWVSDYGDKVMASSSSLLFPGYRSSLNPQGLPGFRRQLSTGHKQLPSVTKQQQLFR
jgi:hypothetical protein